MTGRAPEVRAALAKLVGIDSTSSRSNAEVSSFLEDRLRAAGFDCRRHAYRDEAGAEKINLVARKGGGEGPAPLVLVGHTDCVPFDASWPEALRLTERDGRLCGRGACDTKGFVACALVAATEARLPAGASLAVAFTADEEVGCVGAKHLADERALSARYALIGEPTSLRPIRANKGYCLAEVEVRGVEGHSAYPAAGRSAILHAARLLGAIERHALGPLAQRQDARFAPPFTTVNVGVISGGKAKNIIPGECRFVLEWRPLPGEPVDGVLRDVEALIASERRADPAFEAAIRPLRMDRGFDTPDDCELLRFLAAESGNAPGTVAFGTEGPQLVELGAAPVVFGPGDIQVAHRTGEHVALEQLVRCEELLERVIARFCVA